MLIRYLPGTILGSTNAPSSPTAAFGVLKERPSPGISITRRLEAAAFRREPEFPPYDFGSARKNPFRQRRAIRSASGNPAALAIPSPVIVSRFSMASL